MRDGEKAIEYLQLPDTELPDLILLDLNLPRVNGHEVLEFVKTSERLKRIPVVILTTSSSEKDVNETYDHYANGYIVKPVDVSQFFDVVTQIQDFWFTVVKLPNK